MSKTSDLRFMQVGDKGTLVFNVGLKPEYHVTKDKAYPMEIIASRYGFTIEYTNDDGQKAKTTYDYNTSRDGYESVEVEVDDAVFAERVEALHTKHLTEMVEKHAQEVASWRNYCDGVIAKAKS